MDFRIRQAVLPLQAQSVGEAVGNEALLRVAVFSSAFEVCGFLKCHVCDGLQTQALFGVDAVLLGSKHCALSSCGLVILCGEFSIYPRSCFLLGSLLSFVRDVFCFHVGNVTAVILHVKSRSRGHGAACFVFGLFVPPARGD